MFVGDWRLCQSDSVSEVMCLLESDVFLGDWCLCQSDSVSEMTCLLETSVGVNLTVYQR